VNLRARTNAGSRGGRYPMGVENDLLVFITVTSLSIYQFRSLQYKYMGIEVHLGDEILDHVNPSKSLDGPKFSIKAAKTGTTSLYVS
jgi:hypothetical protein